VQVTKYYLGDHIKKNKMGGSCCMCGGDGKCIQGVGGKTWWKHSTCKN